MKSKLRWFLVCSFAVFGVVAQSVCGQLVDDFNYTNNAALEAVWGAPVVGGITATSFTYNTGAGALNATELNDTDVGGYGKAVFSRSVSQSGDFAASMEFDWNQGSPILGTLFMELAGPGGVIASGGLGDDTGNPGHAYMQIGGGSTYLQPDGGYTSSAEMTFEQQTGAIATSFNTAPIISAAADAVRTTYAMGDSGSALLAIRRSAGTISLSVSYGEELRTLGPISGPTDDVTSLNLIFAGFEFGASPNVLVGDGGGYIAVDKITLSDLPPLGDADWDGVVDINDYLLIQANIFTEAPFGSRIGDVNFDMLVDFDDFRIWKDNFPGGAAAADAAIAVLNTPEPSTFVTCGLGLIAILLGTLGKLPSRKKMLKTIGMP